MAVALLWAPRLATGIEKIDDQHKELFARVNRFFDCCCQGLGQAEVLNVLFFLAEYVDSHFATEEEYMRNHSYPEYSQHKELHDSFKATLRDFALKTARDGVTLDTIVWTNKTLVDWWINHVSKVDKKLGVFVGKDPTIS